MFYIKKKKSIFKYKKSQIKWGHSGKNRLNCQINDETKKENLSHRPTARRFESTNQLRSPCMGLKVTDELIHNLIVVFLHARNVSYS